MIGIHIKSKKMINLKVSLKYAKEIGCSHVQLFNEEISKDFEMKKILKQLGLSMIIHSTYHYNIATEFLPNNWKFKSFMSDVNSAVKNGAVGYVIHLGKQMNLTQSNAYMNMFKTLKYISKNVPTTFNILLETTAGQGTEMCYTMEDLSDFFNMFKNKPSMKNIKFCLDTCHLFAVGYDLRTIEDVNKFILKFNKLIGLQYVGLIHLNDSIHDLGSHLDRHMNIGNGYIGSKGLKYFYQSFTTINVPSILETPVENYAMEVKFLTN